MFCTARWKAYLQNLDTGKENIYSIYHSQMLWFTREDANTHNKNAGEHLERADALLDDCTSMVDSLEETLANTPKPSEVLDWGRLW